jgi:hypothetical protein
MGVDEGDGKAGRKAAMGDRSAGRTGADHQEILHPQKCSGARPSACPENA